MPKASNLLDHFNIALPKAWVWYWFTSTVVSMVCLPFHASALIGSNYQWSFEGSSALLLAIQAVYEDSGFTIASPLAANALETAKLMKEWGQCEESKPVFNEFALQLHVVTCSCWSSEYISFHIYFVVRVSSAIFVSKEYGERKRALLNTMTGVRTLCIIERLVELRLAWQIWHLLVCGHGGEAHTSYKLHSCSAHSVSVFPFCRQNRTQHM